MSAATDLARREGVFCGTSGGATFAAALEVAKTAPIGSKILGMIPDTGERYLSTPLFADVSESMTDEEMALSRSTPGYRFDAPAKPKPAAPAAPEPEADPETLAEVRAIVTETPVVMFALEWCEFSWSVRKMFTEAGIEYRSVDLDSVPFQRDEKGTRYRRALKEICGSPTIPQIFVGGEHIGGATETFDAFNSGALQKKLESLTVAFNAALNRDAYSFLPAWLHPR